MTYSLRSGGWSCLLPTTIVDAAAAPLLDIAAWRVLVYLVAAAERTRPVPGFPPGLLKLRLAEVRDATGYERAKGNRDVIRALLNLCNAVLPLPDGTTTRPLREACLLHNDRFANVRICPALLSACSKPDRYAWVALADLCQLSTPLDARLYFLARQVVRQRWPKFIAYMNSETVFHGRRTALDWSNISKTVTGSLQRVAKAGGFEFAVEAYCSGYWASSDTLSVGVKLSDRPANNWDGMRYEYSAKFFVSADCVVSINGMRRKLARKGAGGPDPRIGEMGPSNPGP